MSRYKKRKTAFNDIYKNEELFDNRGIEKLTQYTTPKFKNPTDDDINSIDFNNRFGIDQNKYKV